MEATPSSELEHEASTAPPFWMPMSTSGVLERTSNTMLDWLQCWLHALSSHMSLLMPAAADKQLPAHTTSLLFLSWFFMHSKAELLQTCPSDKSMLWSLHSCRIYYFSFVLAFFTGFFHENRHICSTGADRLAYAAALRITTWYAWYCWAASDLCG